MSASRRSSRAVRPRPDPLREPFLKLQVRGKENEGNPGKPKCFYECKHSGEHETGAEPHARLSLFVFCEKNVCERWNDR